MIQFDVYIWFFFPFFKVFFCIAEERACEIISFYDWKDHTYASCFYIYWDPHDSAEHVALADVET